MSLVQYFDDARVTGWLAVHGTGAGDSPVAGAASRFGALLGGIGGALGLGQRREAAAQPAAAQSAAQRRPVLRQAITQVARPHSDRSSSIHTRDKVSGWPGGWRKRASADCR